MFVVDIEFGEEQLVELGVLEVAVRCLILDMAFGVIGSLLGLDWIAWFDLDASCSFDILGPVGTEALDRVDMLALEFVLGKSFAFP